MEINTYTLKRNNDEFKDLTENQLMAIAELCMDYYKKGKFDAIDDAYEDKQDEIDDLQDKLSELDEQVEEYSRLADKYEDLVKDIYRAGDIEEAQEFIRDFADFERYNYRWEDWLKNDNNSK